MKFKVYGIYHASKFLGEFEAESQDQAIEFAEMSDANYVNICHHCANEVEFGETTASEFHAEVSEEQ